ncbi:MAG: acetate/propionate family kinase, partial [Bacillota bacterium]
KYQLFDMKQEQVLARGIVERIGIKGSFMEHECDDGKFKFEQEIPNHTQAITLVVDTLKSNKYGVIDSMDEINAVGHRVVHGGEKFAESTLITEEVIEQIKEVSELAPLHNPHNLSGIRVCSELMPETPQVAVFDTAFHQTMPERAYIYALPYEYYQKHGVRRYGFHGTSHKYVASRAAELMDRELKDLKIITCHLGNGASIAAVDGGQSIDTSMGLTPLEGLVMGTRCGDIDPAIIPFIMDKEKLDIKEIDNIMNKKSGLLGVSGISSDSRDVRQAGEQGHHRARVAHEIFDYRVKKYIGSYIAAMGGVDTLVFTAGIGENAAGVRASILENMEFFGINIDRKANQIRGQAREISTEKSKVRVFVIPTNEELVIARDTQEIVAGQ